MSKLGMLARHAHNNAPGHMRSPCTQEQAPLLSQGQVTWDVGAVPVLDQLRADLRRVRNVAEEVRMLFHAGNPERASLRVQELHKVHAECRLMQNLAVSAVKQLIADSLAADLRACGDRQFVVAHCELCAVARLDAGYLLSLHGRPASGRLRR